MVAQLRVADSENIKRHLFDSVTNKPAYLSTSNPSFKPSTHQHFLSLGLQLIFIMVYSVPVLSHIMLCNHRPSNNSEKER